ncbi:MAG: SapC family protein [Rhodocyclales bacterium]|nr:SapC family protein [Rhodocyclales bacterium]
MSEMMFYERVVALNDQTHAQLKVRPATSFAYAAKTNSVPLLASEFFEAAREYPIVFARGEAGPVPAALLGLREAENLYVDSGGKWDARYVPAFVRRYPFVPGKGAEGELLVCIDEASPCFDSKEGEPLFAAGKPTAQLEHAIKFLTEFHQAAALTEQLGRRLDELGLLRQADSLAQLNDGTQVRLNGLNVVDETRLRALDRDAVQELFGSNALAAIYAHLMSLGNLGTLVDRLSRHGTGSKPGGKAAPLR